MLDSLGKQNFSAAAFIGTDEFVTTSAGGVTRWNAQIRYEFDKALNVTHVEIIGADQSSTTSYVIEAIDLIGQIKLSANDFWYTPPLF